MADLATLAGRLAAVPLSSLARRRDGKPMHPRGAVLSAVVERTGVPGDWGVRWLEEQAREDAVVRLSRGAGLPAPLPDVLGLAVRLPGGSRPVDLLLSTTGGGRWTRFLPVPRVEAAVPYSSIMGYRSAAGTLRLAAVPDGPRHLPSDPGPVAAAAPGAAFRLLVARGTGEWVSFGRLVLGDPPSELDPDLHFDAVRNPPPGLLADGPMARLRAPAYAAAQEARSGTGADPFG
ncbi:phosphodiesterase [Geodermatophilus normandii]|uniref:Phosphodiesterase n=1 Tax=Geodermatophilus normandii TaxID=1137989 RepID=A0A6P0GMP1_9ACTN|nr:phosphodiesterase [Geodermatophilus normandii]NEM08607.1 phosphodiesterase [Geodermatophilus normandii]